MNGIFYSTHDMLQKSKGWMIFVPPLKLAIAKKEIDFLGTEKRDLTMGNNADEKPKKSRVGSGSEHCHGPPRQRGPGGGLRLRKFTRRARRTSSRWRENIMSRRVFCPA